MVTLGAFCYVGVFLPGVQNYENYKNPNPAMASRVFAAQTQAIPFTLGLCNEMPPAISSWPAVGVFCSPLDPSLKTVTTCKKQVFVCVYFSAKQRKLEFFLSRVMTTFWYRVIPQKMCIFVGSVSKTKSIFRLIFLESTYNQVLNMYW